MAKALRQIKNQDQILTAARSGASVHMLARQFNLSIEEAANFVETIADEVKLGSTPHRINLRNLLREQVAGAIKTLQEINVGYRLTRDAQGHPIKEDILLTKEDRLAASVRLRAADTLLKHSQRYLDEDVVRGWVERNDTGIDKTIFDFSCEIDESGGITQSVRPVLKVVGEND